MCMTSMERSISMLSLVYGARLLVFTSPLWIHKLFSMSIYEFLFYTAIPKQGNVLVQVFSFLRNPKFFSLKQKRKSLSTCIYISRALVITCIVDVLALL